MAGPAVPYEKLPAGSADALKDAKRPVKAAKLTSSVVYCDSGYTINELKFTTPLDHRGLPDEEQITIVVRAVVGAAEGDAANDTTPRDSPILLTSAKPIAAYLCGGPGSDNPPTAYTAMGNFYLSKGLQLLYMDYRGMGGSHELRADELSAVFTDAKPPGSQKPRLAGLSPEQQAKYLTYFRQDNIVRDLEAVRRRLSVELGLGEQPATEEQKLKLMLIGQSYGGWLTYSYLSFYPEALSAALVTGGIPPIGQTAEEVYRHTFGTMIKANDEFYRQFPGHEDIAKKVVRWVEDNTTNGKTIPMPGGGHLTVGRFLCLGRTLGTTDGEKKVRKSLDACLADINKNDSFSQDTLMSIEGWFRFEARPLYAILQEPIYTEPHLPASAWAAQNVGETLPQFSWLRDGKLPEGRIHFYGEHVFKFHYDQFQSLKPLKQAADILAEKEDWPLLFDPHQLARNTVPIAALSYRRDMFIDCELSEISAGHTQNLVHEIRSDLMHTAVKDKTDIVCPLLWTLLGDAVAKVKGRPAHEVTADDRASAASLLGLLEK